MRERLYRSRDDRVLAGVCGGVADWLDIDPSLVRIVFALLVITGGIGLLLYVVMAIVVPEEPYYVPTPPAAGGTGPAGGSAAAGAPGGTSNLAAPGAAVAGMATGAATAGSGLGIDANQGPAPAGSAPAGSAPMTGADPPSAWMTEREARRAARHDARGQRRADHDGRAGLIFGGILVLVGVWFLVRRYIPAFDGDFLGPIILIGVGAIVLAGALHRNDDEGPTKPR